MLSRCATGWRVQQSTRLPQAQQQALVKPLTQRLCCSAQVASAGHSLSSSCHLRSSTLSSLLPFLSSAPSRGWQSWSTSSSNLQEWTPHEQLREWVFDRIRLCRPARVHLCDGSDAENLQLLTNMQHAGMLIRLNEQLRPNSYVARSTASDVARIEERTFICSENKSDAGFTNNWRDPEEMQAHMNRLFDGCMKGRTMYVIPFCMGPLTVRATLPHTHSYPDSEAAREGQTNRMSLPSPCAVWQSPFTQIGVQITDSPYAVVSMRIMTKMGEVALRMLGDDGAFIPCVHSVGSPIARGVEDSTWPSNEKEKNIVHFPEERRIWSYGSGYGGNALLGKKCLALRIASVMAREEGWLAEHMLIVGITNPQGVKKYIAAAFPSACGKTNLAMMTPHLPGWKVECVGDDIAWMRIGKDGRLWAVNPEAGFFGVAPGTSAKSNPNALATLRANTIFTNVAIKPDGDVWWEGLTDTPPPSVMSWLRTERLVDSGFDAAHPNSRFTVPAHQCPVMDPAWESREGVPISAILFGGRRSTTVPLVYEAKDWEHGVFIGASMSSETTAAAAGKRGILRSDPFAMRPFCGYNMADYFAHWLSMSSRTERSKLPRVFFVNWFRKNKSGKFLWPGFGDNIRVLDWILRRCEQGERGDEGGDIAVDSQIGWLPRLGSVNVEGLGLASGVMEELNEVDAQEWLGDCKRTREFLSQFGDRLPEEISRQLDELQASFEEGAQQQIKETKVE